MKKLITLAVVIVMTAILLYCNTTQEVADVTSEEAVKLQPVGNEAAMTLLKTLKGELVTASQKGGFGSAIEVCNTRAMVLTDSLAQSMENISSVKRTSVKYRNELNAPDKYEEQALAYFADALAKDGKVGGELMNKITTPEGTTFYRYYKPIMVDAVCLNCHGDPATMLPEINQLVSGHYPTDKAINYQAGDLRGVVSVTVEKL
jgi:hypothetical protein